MAATSTDIYKYKRTRSGGHLVSSDFALITVGNATGLIQQGSINYGQKVALISETGSSEMFYVTGQPSGTMTVGRLIGNAGLLANLDIQGEGSLEKGRISTLNLDVSNSRATNQGIKFSQTLDMDNPIIDRLSWSVNTGSLELSETISLIFTTLSHIKNS